MERTRTDGFLTATVMVGCSLFLAAGSSFASPVPASSPAEDSASYEETADEGDVAQLIATLNRDLSRFETRQAETARLLASTAPASPTPSTTEAPHFSALAPNESPRYPSLLIPVAGVAPSELQDTFGASRDGGRRRHRGIDIFAPRGTPVLAVTEGTVSYIGKQPKGGLCVWLESIDGTMSFFYAHLDKWAAGLHEGMKVSKGQLLGFVGKTGNAQRSSPHLHFVVVRDEEHVNPFQILRAGYLEMTAENQPEPSEVVMAGAGGGGQ